LFLSPFNLIFPLLIFSFNKPAALLLCFFLPAPVVDGSSPTPIPHVQVTLKGKKYDINDVTTVAELQERLEEASGIAPSQQGKILFQGKRLTQDNPLTEAGVSDGDQLNCVPITKKKTTTSTTTTTTTTSTTSDESSNVPAAASAAAPGDSIKDMLKSAGMDTSAMEDMMKNMMGGEGGGGSGNAPSMQESMEMMTSMMKSPLFTEYMNDPERLEESRQMILSNPMLKSMMSSMPGMEDLLNSPEAWREAMQAAASLYANIDQEDLMKAMMEGVDASLAGSSGAGPAGLFDGTMGSASTTPTALDELSEGEE
jgi:hypothetical protein